MSEWPEWSLLHPARRPYTPSHATNIRERFALERHRQAERQRIADRERRDREHAEERAYDATRELLDRSSR